MTSPADRQRSSWVITEPLPVGLLVIAGAGVLLVSVAAFFRVPLLPSIGEELSLSAADLGLLTMAFGIGRLLTDLPAGRLADRAAPGIAFALAGALVAGGFAAVGSWRTAEAAAGVLGLGTVGLLLARRRPAQHREDAGRSARPGHVAAPAAAGRAAVATAIRLPERVVLYGISFAVFFTLAAMPQTLVPIIGADVSGLRAGAIGLALGVGGLCRFAGALSGGVVSDRLGRKAALVPGLALNAVGIALLAVNGGVRLWVLGIVLMSLGSFGVSVAATILADLSQSGGVGRRLGRFRFYGDLGVIAGPAIAGALLAGAGRGTAVLTVAALPAALAVAAALLLTETRRNTGSSFEADA